MTGDDGTSARRRAEEERNRADYLAIRAGRLPPSALEHGHIVGPSGGAWYAPVRGRPGGLRRSPRPRPRMPINQRLKAALLRNPIVVWPIGGLALVGWFLGIRAPERVKRLFRVRDRSRREIRRRRRRHEEQLRLYPPRPRR